MKRLWRCPTCNMERFTEDTIIIKSCWVCQVSMEYVRDE